MGELENSPPRWRLGYIDGLRGLAILMVVVLHATQHYQPRHGFWRELAGQGGRGVQLFFVVSAFTLALSWKRRASAGLPWMRDYFIRRFFRIAPAFYLAIFLYWVQPFGRPVDMNPGGPRGWQILATATFAHAWHPRAMNSVVPGSWSVGVEAAFYVLFPLLVVATRKLWWCAALWLAAVIAAADLTPPLFYWMKGWMPPGEIYLTKSFAFLWFGAQLPSFVSGLTCAALVFAAGERWKGRWGAGLAALGAAGYAWMATVDFRVFGTQILAPLFFSAMLLGLHAHPGWWERIKGMGFLGKISFSGYLWHFAVLDLTDRFLPAFRQRPPTSWGWLAYLAFVLAATMAVAWLSYRFVELPGMALGRRWIERLGRPGPAAVSPPG